MFLVVTLNSSKISIFLILGYGGKRAKIRHMWRLEKEILMQFVWLEKTIDKQ